MRALCLLALTTVTLSACGSSPTRVCEHVVEVTRAESAAAAASIDMPTCEAQLEIERERLGSAQWNDLAGCLVGAATLEAMSACDRPVQ